jgi:hypothetical protein
VVQCCRGGSVAQRRAACLFVAGRLASSATPKTAGEDTRPKRCNDVCRATAPIADSKSDTLVRPLTLVIPHRLPGPLDRAASTVDLIVIRSVTGTLFPLPANSLGRVPLGVTFHFLGSARACPLRRLAEELSRDIEYPGKESFRRGAGNGTLLARPPPTTIPIRLLGGRERSPTRHASNGGDIKGDDPWLVSSSAPGSRREIP